MSIQEVTEQVNQLGNAWEQFKHVNDARLSEIEQKGSADGLYTEHLANINGAMDHYKHRIDRLETAHARPGVDMNTKAGAPEQQSEYAKAFCNYLRKGQDAGLEGLELKALSVGSDPDGGYTVTPAMSANINAIVFESSPIRQLAAVETISTDSLEIIDDKDSAATGWVAETGTVSETASPQIGKHTIPTHGLYAQPKATQKLIDDSAIDIENWLAGKIADVFSRQENTAFVSGSGVSQPRGFLTYAAGTSWGEIEQINSGTSGAVTSDGLIKLYYSLKDAYARNATFLMNRSTLQAVRLLKESTTDQTSDRTAQKHERTTDQYLWQPGLAAGTPDTLLGVPALSASDMPVLAADSLSVVVADFQAAYQIVDRQGIQILRDPFTEKPFVKFYTTKRVGGDVVNYEAIKLMKLAA